jgi:hypothetical protein
MTPDAGAGGDHRGLRPGAAEARRRVGCRAARELAIGLASLGITAFVFSPVLTGERTFFAEQDNSIQSFAWLTKVFTAWRAMDVPLWDFNVQAGTSFVGELQTGAFYPLAILLAWMRVPPDLHAFELFVLLHFAMAFYFMLWFLRGEVRWEAAVVGALVFAFVGTVARRASAQANIFAGMVYLPLVLGLFLRGLRSEAGLLRNPWLHASGIALGGAMLAGHMQPYIHAATALGFLVPFICLGGGIERWRRTAAALLLVGLVSVTVTVVQWLPTLEYLEHSYRWVGSDQPIRGLSRPPHELYAQLEILHPSQLGSFFSPAVDLRDGAMLFVTLTGLALAVVGSFVPSRLGRFSLVLAVFAILLALGDHTLVGYYSWYVPVLGYVREPVRALFLYQFGAAVLAALGMNLIGSLVSRHTVAVALSLAIAGLIVFEAVRMRDWVIHPVGSELVPTKYYAGDSLLRYVERRMAEDSRLYRIVDQGRVLPPNVGDVYAIPATGGHRATMNAGLFDFLSRDWSLGSRGFNLLGARYVISASPIEGLPEVYRSARGRVFERPGALPLFQIVTPSGERRAAAVSAVVWSQNSVSFTLGNASPGELVFAQPMYPGWRVALDGRTMAPGPHDIFMSVPLSGHERTVTWAYRPSFPWIGSATALLALLAAAWSAATAWMRPPGRPVRPGTPAS